MKRLIFWGTFCAVPVLLLSAAFAGFPGNDAAPVSGDYKLLAPITHGDLTIFPVVSGKTRDTSGFLTLDEGMRSGEVVVTEVGNLHGAMRRRRSTPVYSRGAQVNKLVLVNNSKLPLILLAGEVVTGGKQDRVVGKDRIIPAESDPVDLAVFCVEPGRWVESSTKFDTHASVMAQPSVRIEGDGGCRPAQGVGRSEQCPLEHGATRGGRHSCWRASGRRWRRGQFRLGGKWPFCRPRAAGHNFIRPGDRKLGGEAAGGLHHGTHAEVV